MADEIVVDTTVLQKANAPITAPGNLRGDFAKRIEILRGIFRGDTTVLFSRRLVAEYRKQLPRPRNDFIRAFFEILSRQRNAVENYARWPGRLREKARRCRFPKEDDHVLRTAVRSTPTAVITEEGRMLAASDCIHREFRVRIRGI